MTLEQEKILSLLEEGKINAAEADELLATIDASDMAFDDLSLGENPPDMSRLRQMWRIPFSISLTILGLSATILLSLRGVKNRRGRFIKTLTLPITILAALAALVSYWSKSAPWIHVRVQQESGQRFAISLPLPLQPVRSGIDMARQWVTDDKSGDILDAASEFLTAIDSQEAGDPLTIDVDDGDKVQVFVG